MKTKGCFAGSHARQFGKEWTPLQKLKRHGNRADRCYFPSAAQHNSPYTPRHRRPAYLQETQIDPPRLQRVVCHWVKQQARAPGG